MALAKGILRWARLSWSSVMILRFPLVQFLIAYHTGGWTPNGGSSAVQGPPRPNKSAELPPAALRSVSKGVIMSSVEEKLQSASTSLFEAAKSGDEAAARSALEASFAADVLVGPDGICTSMPVSEWKSGPVRCCTLSCGGEGHSFP